MANKKCDVFQKNQRNSRKIECMQVICGPATFWNTQNCHQISFFFEFTIENMYF